MYCPLKITQNTAIIVQIAPYTCTPYKGEKIIYIYFIFSYHISAVVSPWHFFYCIPPKISKWTWS